MRKILFNPSSNSSFDVLGTMLQVIGVEEAQTAIVFVPVDALAALKALHNAVALR